MDLYIDLNESSVEHIPLNICINMQYGHIYPAHAQGVKQSVCMSVVIVVVRTKIASLGVLGP